MPSPRGLILAPYYSHIAFDEGSRLHLTGESFTWDLGDLGTVLPSVVQIRSNEARDSAGLEFDYRVDYAQVRSRVDTSCGWMAEEVDGCGSSGRVPLLAEAGLEGAVVGLARAELRQLVEVHDAADVVE
ncbi:MAG: hypothetical protein ACODAJ_05635 [Planctomycetota bacterium]